MISKMLIKIKMYNVNYFPVKSTDNKSLTVKTNKKKTIGNFLLY